MISKHIFLTIVGFLSVVLAAAFLPEQSPKVAAVKNALFKKLSNEQLIIHNQVLADIKTDFNVPDDIWNEYMNAFNDAINSDDLLGASNSAAVDSNKPWIIQRTRELLCEYGINPDRVAIHEVTTKGSNGEATQDIDENNKIIHTIDINVEWFNAFSKEMQEAFVRHEIMHLLNYDPIEGGYILFMLESIGNDLKEVAKHPTIVAYNQQRELRADILGSCGSITTAHALCKHYTQYAQKKSEQKQTWLTHPPHEVRAEHLAHLLVDMDVQPKTVIT